LGRQQREYVPTASAEGQEGVRKAEDLPAIPTTIGTCPGPRWLSVSGIATENSDPALVRELYMPDWKAWLGDEGGDRDGSASDPRIALILVEAESVTYMKVTKPRPVVVFEVAKAMVTGSPPRIGDVRTVNEREIQRGRQRGAVNLTRPFSGACQPVE
jgi:general stress protein 26